MKISNSKKQLAKIIESLQPQPAIAILSRANDVFAVAAGGGIADSTGRRVSRQLGHRSQAQCADSRVLRPHRPDPALRQRAPGASRQRPGAGGHAGPGITVQREVGPERRAEDAGQPWLDILNPSSFDAGHVIVNVEEGGKDYSVTYLTANDESMTVKSVMRFKS